VTYQEYVVLDSAGRLQIPRDWLEDLGIGKRARLEFDEDKVIIHPVEDDQATRSTKHLSLEEQIELLFSEAPASQKKNSFFKRRAKNFDNK
jgi:bifunctional DNA-binding transcriptional regulator/antitoxin component of YhaV-PrlF toxin-antitoxin module